MQKNFFSRSAQSTVEYMLLVTVVVGFLIVFYKGNLFRGALDRTYSPGIADVGDAADRLWKATSPPQRPRQALVQLPPANGGGNGGGNPQENDPRADPPQDPERGDPQPCDNNPWDPNCNSFYYEPEYDPASPLPYYYDSEPGDPQAGDPNPADDSQYIGNGSATTMDPCEQNPNAIGC